MLSNVSGTSARVNFTITESGYYRLCHQTWASPEPLAFQPFGDIFHVPAFGPTHYAGDGGLIVGSVEPVTVSGGSGLDRRPGQDAMKVVEAAGNCSHQPAGGTSEVTDLGPDDQYENATSWATASFTFSSGGSYQVYATVLYCVYYILSICTYEAFQTEFPIRVYVHGVNARCATSSLEGSGSL